MNAPSAFMLAAIEVIGFVLNLYIWMLVIGAILSWLAIFNVINPRNRVVQMVADFIERMTEPLLRPIRRVIPPMGGVDISPLILILIIMFLQRFLTHLVF